MKRFFFLSAVVAVLTAAPISSAQIDQCFGFEYDDGLVWSASKHKPLLNKLETVNSAEDINVNAVDGRISTQPNNTFKLAESELDSGLHKDGYIFWDGHLRKYYYYEPNDPGIAPRPLVILLHGGTFSINRFLGLGFWGAAPFNQWLAIAGEDKFYVAIPEGRNFYWNDCRGDCPSCSDENDIGFLNEMINQLMNKYSIDSTRIYATGESNGGHMSYRLAMELSHRIAAIGVVIAGFPAQNVCSGPVNPVPVLIMNGTDDPISPWDGGDIFYQDRGTVLSTYESVSFWVRHNDCDLIPQYFDFPDLIAEDSSTVKLEKYSNGIEGTEVYLYRIDGGGHTSPSIEELYIDSVLDTLGLGVQNHDIEMSREVWDFFKRHTLSGKSSVINYSDDLSVKTFHLSQNYPNPFNPTTHIEYQLDRASDVEVNIFNLQGQRVVRLMKGFQKAGFHKSDWNGKDESERAVVSGVYFYQLKAGDNVETKKMILLR